MFLCGFTFLHDVDDGFGSQSVVQRNGDQGVCVTCELADGPLHTHTHTNTEAEHLRIRKSVFVESFYHLSINVSLLLHLGSCLAAGLHK